MKEIKKQWIITPLERKIIEFFLNSKLTEVKDRTDKGFEGALQVGSVLRETTLLFISSNHMKHGGAWSYLEQILCFDSHNDLYCSPSVLGYGMTDIFHHDHSHSTFVALCVAKVNYVHVYIEFHPKWKITFFSNVFFLPVPH